MLGGQSIHALFHCNDLYLSAKNAFIRQDKKSHPGNLQEIQAKVRLDVVLL